MLNHPTSQYRPNLISRFPPARTPSRHTVGKASAASRCSQRSSACPSLRSGCRRGDWAEGLCGGGRCADHKRTSVRISIRCSFAPGFAHRTSVESQEDRSHEQQDPFIDWTRNRQETDSGDPAERFRNTTVVGQQPDRAEDSAHESLHGSIVERLTPTADRSRFAAINQVGPRWWNIRPRGTGLDNRGARYRLFAPGVPRIRGETQMTRKVAT